ncbi:hypothetical protein ACOTTU_23275 [Roseobacter sp. EG26]|uniref:hypothetical protein n=1 Tax=Roseobacter sp. EG26 TaxID=3412477 RepID=UPI003CE5856D
MTDVRLRADGPPIIPVIFQGDFIRNGMIATCCAVVLCGCAEENLLDAERGLIDELQVGNKVSIAPETKLVELASYSRKMSVAYRNAARKTASTQDVQSFLTFVPAGSFVTGAVGSASDRALANKAIAGAAVQQIGLRTAPKLAISGMYTGAKRLNCIATVAAVWHHTLQDQDDSTLKAASALVFGATEEVRITMRESSVREVADYGELVTALTPPPVNQPGVAPKQMQASKITKFSNDLEKRLKKAKRKRISATNRIGRSESCLRYAKVSLITYRYDQAGTPKPTSTGNTDREMFTRLGLVPTARFALTRISSVARPSVMTTAESARCLLYCKIEDFSVCTPLAGRHCVLLCTLSSMALSRMSALSRASFWPVRSTSGTNSPFAIAAIVPAVPIRTCGGSFLATLCFPQNRSFHHA